MQSATSILALNADQLSEAGSLGVASIPLTGEDNEQREHPGNNPDLFIALPEVAKRLSMTTRSIQKLIALGKFPSPVDAGRSQRWRVADVNRHRASLRLTRIMKDGNGDSEYLAGSDLEQPEGYGRIPADEGFDKGPRLLLEKKLTVPQAAKAMGIGASSLRRIIIEGRLPVLKMQRKVLILESDAEAFLQASRVIVKQTQNTNRRLPSLPKCVTESEHLR